MNFMDDQAFDFNLSADLGFVSALHCCCLASFALSIFFEAEDRKERSFLVACYAGSFLVFLPCNPMV